MESYSRGRRGVPAKDVGVERRARVQIPHSPPAKDVGVERRARVQIPHSPPRGG